MIVVTAPKNTKMYEEIRTSRVSRDMMLFVRPLRLPRVRWMMDDDLRIRRSLDEDDRLNEDEMISEGRNLSMIQIS